MRPDAVIIAVRLLTNPLVRNQVEYAASLSYEALVHSIRLPFDYVTITVAELTYLTNERDLDMAQGLNEKGEQRASVQFDLKQPERWLRKAKSIPSEMLSAYMPGFDMTPSAAPSIKDRVAQPNDTGAVARLGELHPEGHVAQLGQGSSCRLISYGVTTCQS